MKLLLLIFTSVVTVIGGALSLFGLLTIITLATRLAVIDHGRMIAFVSLLIGLPLLLLGILALVEF